MRAEQEVREEVIVTKMGESGGKRSILDVLKVDLKGFMELLDGTYESCKPSKILAEATE